MVRSLSFAASAILFAAMWSIAEAQVRPPLPEQPDSSVGYASVSAALAGLRSRPDLTVSEQADWTVMEDRASYTIWSFAPKGDPAYPSVVKRQVMKTGNGIVVRMNVLCEASKIACDNLVVAFQNLNAKMKQGFERHAQQ